MSRNLIEYPITMQEVLTAIEHALMQEDDDDRIGGQNAAILARILELAPHRFTAEDFKV
jgi:hypothetical protein